MCTRNKYKLKSIISLRKRSTVFIMNLMIFREVLLGSILNCKTFYWEGNITFQWHPPSSFIHPQGGLDLCKHTNWNLVLLENGVRKQEIVCRFLLQCKMVGSHSDYWTHACRWWSPIAWSNFILDRRKSKHRACCNTNKLPGYQWKCSLGLVFNKRSFRTGH